MQPSKLVKSTVNLSCYSKRGGLEGKRKEVVKGIYFKGHQGRRPSQGIYKNKAPPLCQIRYKR
jgi:hypothetical protein